MRICLLPDVMVVHQKNGAISEKCCKKHSYKIQSLRRYVNKEKNIKNVDDVQLFPNFDYQDYLKYFAFYPNFFSTEAHILCFVQFKEIFRILAVKFV